MKIEKLTVRAVPQDMERREALDRVYLRFLRRRLEESGLSPGQKALALEELAARLRAGEEEGPF